MSGGDFYAAPKIVTVRKAHVCAYCGETIPAGTPWRAHGKRPLDASVLEALRMSALPAICQ